MSIFWLSATITILRISFKPIGIHEFTSMTQTSVALRSSRMVRLEDRKWLEPQVYPQYMPQAAEGTFTLAGHGKAVHDTQ